MINWFFTLSIFVQIFVIYFALLNIITFFAYGFDKMKSRGEGRRTPEKTLWLLTLLGGSPAALLAMHYFRHKTKKISFQAIIIIIIAVQVTAGIYLYTFLQNQ
jgi:uncharacterized membrane protein YsdA (DUF1294 family)